MDLIRSAMKFLASLIPSPRYVRHLERQLEEVKEERRQAINAMLGHSGFNPIATGDTEPTSPKRIRIAPSQWRRITEQADRDSQGKKTPS